jgi:hypothetical protein
MQLLNHGPRHDDLFITRRAQPFSKRIYVICDRQMINKLS